MIHTPLYKTTTNEFYEMNIFYLYHYEPFGGDKPILDSNAKRTSDVRLVLATYYSLEAMKKGDISFDDGFFIMDLARQFEGTIASDSATYWTVCFDLKNLTVEWTSLYNQERRTIDMKQLSFENTGEFVMERVSFHLTKAVNGSSYQEVLNNTEKVIEEWIETAKLLGKDIPEPKGRLKYA